MSIKGRDTFLFWGISLCAIGGSLAWSPWALVIGGLVLVGIAMLP